MVNILNYYKKKFYLNLLRLKNKLKQTYFRWKLKRLTKKEIRLYSRAIIHIFAFVNQIGIPKNKKEKEQLKYVVEKYDEYIERLEGYIKNARDYIS